MNFILSFLSIIRPLNIVTAISCILVVYFITDVKNLTLIIYPSIIIGCYMAAGNILNDWIDIEADKINKPSRPLVIYDVNHYLLFSIVFLLFAIGSWITIYIDVYAMYVAIFFAMPCIISYEIVFKRSPIIGNIIISSLVGVVFIFAELSFHQSISVTWRAAVLAFFLNLIREMIKDIEDIEGDAQSQYNTFPIIAGIPTTIVVLRIITIFFIILSLLPIFTSYYLWYYIPLIVFLIHLPLLYIIIRLTDNITPKECAKYSKVLKLLIINGIITIVISTI